MNEPLTRACECGADMNAIAPGHAWGAALLGVREFCSPQCVRWALKLDACRARAEQAERERVTWTKEAGEHRAAVLNAHKELGFPEWGKGPATEWPRKARNHIDALSAQVNALREALEKVAPFVHGWMGFSDAAVQREHDECGAAVDAALAATPAAPPTTQP